MTLQIHAVTEIGSSDLRRLVIDNLGALLGEGARLVGNLPQIDDCCIATSNTYDGPMLVSFDAVDPQRDHVRAVLEAGRRQRQAANRAPHASGDGRRQIGAQYVEEVHARAAQAHLPSHKQSSYRTALSGDLRVG